MIIAPTHPLQLVAGLTLWAICFVALYGGLSVGCAVAPPDPADGAINWLNASLLLMTLALVVVMLIGARHCSRVALRKESPAASRSLIAGVAAALYLLAAAASVAIAVPVLVLPPCI